MSDQRFERLEALKAEAAETLRPPIDSDKVTCWKPGDDTNMPPPPPMTLERYLEMKQRETAS